MSESRLLRRFRNWHDRYIGAALLALAKHDFAADLGKQRMIFAHGDVHAGMDLGAALANQNVAGKDDLAAVALGAEPLTRRIAPVARRAACFLVCHGAILTRVDFGDLDPREVLAVAALAVGVLAPPLFEGDD